MTKTKQQGNSPDVDLSNANHKLEELYTAFAGAPERLAGLANYIKTLHKTFERLRISLQQTSRPFEGYDGFESTLRDCELFIQRSKPQENGKGWLFMEDEFTKLQGRIMMQISVMSTSTIVLLAETFFSNDDREPVTSQQTAQPTVSAPNKSIQDPEFEQLWAKIKRVVYRRKRKPMPEPKNNSESIMEVEGLEKEVQKQVRQLMLNQPLIPETTSNGRRQVPDNPQSRQPLDLVALSDDKLLERTQQQERYLLSASGQRLPRRERMNSFSRAPSRVWTLPDDHDQPVISENPCPPILGDGKIYIKLPKPHHYELRRIEWIVTNKKRKIKCTATDETVTIIHDLPPRPKRHLITNHAHVGGSADASFSEKLNIEIKGSKEVTGEAFITYNFRRPESLEQLQKMVREKDLLHTFCVNKIISGDGDEASYQHLKLWKDHKSRLYTLSFYKNNTDKKRHLEFDLSAFAETPTKCTKIDRIVRLDFVHDSTPLRRSFSDGPFNVSGNSKKRNSVVSLNSMRSDATTKYVEQMRALGESINFLSLEFSYSKDVLTFITALKRIHETIKRESLFTPFHDSDEEPSTFGEPTCAYILARKSSDMPAVLPNPRLSTDVSPTSLSPGTISRPISDLPTDVSPTSLSSGTNSIQREHRDYTVGWICALPIELTAAIAMLDTRHQPLSKHAKEKNAYAVGSIGYHNVVITCLPAGMIGNNSAASVATEMEYSFPNISIRLMVGIGGGVPSTEHDIRLGDVVISRPGPHDGGVVQYDFGKMIKGGVFEKTGSLASPPPALLSAVSHLEALNNNDGSKISTFLEAFNTENLKSKFEYPSADRDRLFASDYDHVQEQATCVNCDKSRLVNRPPRKTLPIVHHGTIASGNKVMKDAKSRDELGRKLGALCFEMEAAGLMNTFPCIVIRGICDYADTHKNKEWQGYAAATAAAYAKELLINIPPSQIN